MNTTTHRDEEYVSAIGRDGKPTGTRDIGVPAYGCEYVPLQVREYDGEHCNQINTGLAPADARRLGAMLLDEADRIDPACTTTVTVMRVGPWAELFPNGRRIFYEGDEPEKFAQEILAEFGIDLSANEGWGEYIPGDDSYAGFHSYGFRCPPEHLDAIYGSHRYPLGS